MPKTKSRAVAEDATGFNSGAAFAMPKGCLCSVAELMQEANLLLLGLYLRRNHSPWQHSELACCFTGGKAEHEHN